MDFLSLPYEFLKWHYGAMVFDILSIYKINCLRIKSLFSINKLSSNVFNLIVLDFRGGKNSNLVVNYLFEVSLRISGFLFKIFSIVLYPVVLVFSIIFSSVILGIWLILPILVVSLFANGVMYLFI